MEEALISLYIHLIPEKDTEVRESFKITINPNASVADL